MPKLPLLLPLVRKYLEKDPITAAHHLETMPLEEALNVLKALPAGLSAQIFPLLNVDEAAALLREISPELFREIAERLEPEKGASILLALSEHERKRLIEHLPQKVKKEIQDILTFPEGSVGRIMSPVFTSFHTGTTVREAVDKIRSMVRKRAPMTYVYIVDEENKLVGILNMRDLMVAEGKETVGSVMRTDVFAVDGFMDREDLARIFAEKRYFAAPVVDGEHRLIGVVKSDQLLRGVHEEATEDIQKMVGVAANERSFSPLRFSLKTRLPWLHINLATAFLAAGVVALFEGIIAKVTALAVFLPVVAGEGGNAGAQSLAVVMRGLVMREIPKGRVKKLVVKETMLGFINGVVIGLVTGLAAWLWMGMPFLGVVIALAMWITMIFSGFSGALIPIVMKKVGFDPAQSSSIILTTVIDVVGFFTFLGLAVLFQNLII